MYSTNARAAYVDNSITTASPARLLIMLFDRLVLDIERGLAAQLKGDWLAASPHLVHGQDILIELRTSLKPEAMAGGQELAALYDYLRRRLVDANVKRDIRATKECLIFSRDLCETWKKAALQAADS